MLFSFDARPLPINTQQLSLLVLLFLIVAPDVPYQWLGLLAEIYFQSQ